jgi:hypothetical protein
MAKFHDREEYMDWCDSIISRIYYANIAMNHEAIKKAISEIADTLHMSEGEHLFDGDDIDSTDGTDNCGE